MKAIITKAVNTIQATAKKGQTFDIVKETENSFQVLIDGKVRMISKKNAEVLAEPKKKRVGVISEMITILNTGFVTKNQILEKLHDIFPERQTASMWNTINCQFSKSAEETLRIEREQKVKIITKEKKGEKLFKLKLS